jgi:hypothetical protein
MKYSVSYPGLAGTFRASEVTVTAGASTGQTITMALPQDMVPGPFYIRIDSQAQFHNPTTTGQSTILLSQSNGESLESRGFFVVDESAGNSLDNLPGEVDGTVIVSGTALAGALIYASTAPVPTLSSLSMGPDSAFSAARDPGTEVYMASSDADGNYALKLPYLSGGSTYNIAAAYSITQSAGTCMNMGSLSSWSVTVNSSTPVTGKNFTSFQALP